MLRRIAASLALSLLALSATASAEEKKTESIKIGTLAPAESPWGQVFKTWQRAIRERTKLPEGQKTAEGKDYALDLSFFWNGQQGDEAAMVTKMKSGQLDAAAAITGRGARQIHPPILVLQLPGSFYDLGEARQGALKPCALYFEKAMDAAGFALPVGGRGSSPAGFRRLCRCCAGDLKGKKPYVLA